MVDNQEYRQEMCKCWEEFLQKHEISTADGVTADAFIMAFDYAYALGKQVGKQEKDADTVTIAKDVYDKLCKYSRYVANWVPYFDVCPICGEYNQKGCVCANCNNDKNVTVSFE